MPARHQTVSRSPTLVGRVHRTTGSRPARVCSRASQHSRWNRWRASTHQNRRVMNRRDHGTAKMMPIAAARTTAAQMMVIWRDSQ